LKDTSGLSGKVIEWFQSYLEQHSQRVSVGGILSEVQFFLFSVPQCSVFGPLVFTMYTRHNGFITHWVGVKHYLYADEPQLYISLDLDNELNPPLQHCMADIRLWITQNLLNLNENKTNIINLASPHCVKSLKTPAVQMDASWITPNGSNKLFRGYFWQIITYTTSEVRISKHYCQFIYIHNKKYQ